MKKICFETDQDGFYGTYYENTEGADCAVIGLFGDDPNDYMAKCGAKWLHKNGVNALCMSPGNHNYSHVNCPLERIETAVTWLMTHGNRKVGIMGMSTAGMEALAATSFFPDITLTFGLTASDLSRVKRMDARSGLCPELLHFPIVGNHLLICHLSTNIQRIGKRLRPKQKDQEIFYARPVFLQILKRNVSIQRKK